MWWDVTDYYKQLEVSLGEALLHNPKDLCLPDGRVVFCGAVRPRGYRAFPVCPTCKELKCL